MLLSLLLTITSALAGGGYYDDGGGCTDGETNICCIISGVCLFIIFGLAIIGPKPPEQER